MQTYVFNRESCLKKWLYPKWKQPHRMVHCREKHVVVILFGKIFCRLNKFVFVAVLLIKITEKR